VRRPLAWAALALWSCTYQPRFEKTRCSAEHGCPAGLVCVQDPPASWVCRLPVGAPDATAEDGAAPDGAAPALTADAPVPPADAPTSPPADVAAHELALPADTADDPAPVDVPGPDACVPAPECPTAPATACSNESTLIICTNDHGCPTAVRLYCQPGAPCQGMFPTAACMCEHIPECQDRIGSFCVANVLVRCNVGKTGCLEKMMMIACPADQVCVPGPVEGGSCVRPRDAGVSH
jgi:hypothetical protein